MTTRKIVSEFINKDTAGIVLDYLIEPRRTSRKVKRARQREEREKQKQRKRASTRLYLLNTYQDWLRMGYNDVWPNFLKFHLKIGDDEIKAAAQEALLEVPAWALAL